MNTLTNTPIQLKITGAVLAIAALAIVLAWVAITAGPTMAQTDPYDDPKPCGPDQVPGNPDEIVTSGHYAVFDAYWDTGKQTLNNNLCPPSVTHVETPGSGGGFGQKPTPPTTTHTRTASNVDIQRTVFHLDPSFQHTLTAPDVENYDFFQVGDTDAVGQTVWWLRTGDDAMTPDVTETESALKMGFSAGLFDSKYWYLEDGTAEGAEPLQYEFEAVREPGIPPEEYGHFFVFDDSPPSDGVNKTAEWDSSDADTNELQMYPGEYKHLQWAFTKPGTYVLSVHLKGHVRQDNPHEDTDPDYDENWKPISGDSTVTSEVKQYTFHVGALTLNHEPTFQVERSVEEHAPHNAEHVTLVGAPIPVYQGDDDDLTFTLTGPGHSLFSVAADADANGNAQIKVAGNLDHEVLSEYRLTLGVSDNKDHESNTDASVDSRISVKINVTDQPEVERSVPENSAADTLVGDAVEVTDAGTNTLAYALSGHGHNLFSVERDATTGNAQIKTAGLGGLDHEARSTYHLTLSVTDYSDPLDNYTLVVIVTVTDDVAEDDVAEAGTTDLGVTIKSLTGDGVLPQTITIDTNNPKPAVRLWASIGDLPQGATDLRVGWGVQDPAGDPQHNMHTGSEFHKTFAYDTAATRAFQVRIEYDLDGQQHWFWSPVVNVIWSQP